MSPRTARFALGGAAIVATTALLFESDLPFTERVYRRRGTPWIHEPPRAYVLGVVLALLHQRRDTFMLVGAILGGVVGLANSASLDEVCIGGGDVFVCGYRSFFGWEIAPLATWALWTAIGAAIGAAVGLLALRATRRP